MSVDRKSITNDLNAIANAVARDEDLTKVAGEIAIVLENMAELSDEEATGGKETKTDGESAEEDETSSPPA